MATQNTNAVAWSGTERLTPNMTSEQRGGGDCAKAFVVV